MSRQEPTFYQLEFSSDAPFWAGAADTARRTFLMPLSNPAEFLAFGVCGPAGAVHFVARGRLREHVGAFISRMAEAGATVELYERPPLPWSLVKRYLSDLPYEHQEVEGPKEPPVQGIAAYGGGADADGTKWLQEATVPLSSAEQTWPSLDSPREVIIMPSGNNEEFLAMGVCLPGSSDTKNRFVFAARGMVGTQLGDFITRMRLNGATVRLHDWPQQPYLRLYLKKHYNAFFVPPPAATQSAAQPTYMEAAS